MSDFGTWLGSNAVGILALAVAIGIPLFQQRRRVTVSGSVGTVASAPPLQDGSFRNEHYLAVHVRLIGPSVTVEEISIEAEEPPPPGQGYGIARADGLLGQMTAMAGIPPWPFDRAGELLTDGESRRWSMVVTAPEVMLNPSGALKCRVVVRLSTGRTVKSGWTWYPVRPVGKAA